LRKLLEHGALVGFDLHVDEVDHDDAADVAQPQLAGHFLRASRLVRKMVSSWFFCR